MILHHYPMSPFSEKIRAMFGYTNMHWQSVIVPEMPPRAHLDILTGGYRKIPVAQIGADVFCDTRTITTEIADLSGRPEIALKYSNDDIRAFVREVDLDIFLACVLSANGRVLLGKMRREHSILHVIRFLIDRVNMGRKATVKAKPGAAAKKRVSRHLEDLERRLTADFLFGDTPTIGDFAAYHGLWFLRDLGESGYVRNFQSVDAWLDRIKAFGHGSETRISEADALDIARKATPRPLPEDAMSDDPFLGKSVRIAPNDYGTDSVTGMLVASTPTRWIIHRDHDRCGGLNVHFPKHGFAIKAG